MRNDNRKYFRNASSNYNNLFQERNIKFIDQYTTLDISKLKDIGTEFNFLIHKVAPFETIHDISIKYYESPQYGWLICYTNKIGSELEINIGKILKIYYPLQSILQLVSQG